MKVSRRLIFEVCANCGKKILDDESALLIDDHNDLIFCDETCLRENFATEIARLEESHAALRSKEDIALTEFKTFESYLAPLLDDPDEIWEPDRVEEEDPLNIFIGEFLHEKERIWYIAAVYPNEGKPSFVYTHFPTKDEKLVQLYRQGTLLFDGAEAEEHEADEEMDEDNIAIEYYVDMLEHRSDADIDLDDFSTYHDLRIPTMEHPEEIWRQIDDLGNTFLFYISHHQKEPEVVAYVVVAVEDDLTERSIPVFGFPTLDQKLLDRFRVGELVFKASDDF
jgi:hypothetical protein